MKKRCNSGVSLTYLDCRKLGGSNINSLFNELSSACQSHSQFKRNELTYLLLLHDVWFPEKKQKIYIITI